MLTATLATEHPDDKADGADAEAGAGDSRNDDRKQQPLVAVLQETAGLLGAARVDELHCCAGVEGWPERRGIFLSSLHGRRNRSR